MATNSENVGGGLSPNVAAALSYLFGFISGILFFMLSKDKYVRFHALQSTIVSIAFIALSYVLNIMNLGMLASLISLASFVVIIIMIVKAYQGTKYKLPIAGDIAEKNA